MQSKRHSILPILNIDSNNWFIQDLDSMFNLVIPIYVDNEFETLPQAEQFLEDFIHEKKTD